MAAEAALRRPIDEDLVGAVRTFGEHGPAYEVLGIEDKELSLVRVIESGETLTYPIANVRTDPEA